MATLTQSQIYTIAILTGLPNPRVMAAVAMAESSGRTDVVNSIGCVGLWQINQPEWVKDHPSWTQDWLKNPLNNATAAKVVYDAQGLKAWEAYTNGDYAKYLGQQVSNLGGSYQNGQIVNASWWDDLKHYWQGIGEGATGTVEGLGGGLVDATGLSGLGQVADSIYGIAEATQKAGTWLSKGSNWVRIAYVGGGTLVVLMALYSIAANTTAGRQAKSAAVKTAGMIKKVAP
jgi:hypothetical protein